MSGWEGLSPSSFFGHQVQDGTHAGLIGEKFAAQFEGIFSAGVGQFIEKAFDGKAGVGLADDGVRPSNRIAGGVERSDETIVPHGAIPPAGKVVFARPDNLYGGL